MSKLDLKLKNITKIGYQQKAIAHKIVHTQFHTFFSNYAVVNNQ